ncbi:aromatic ring-hydroxylating oxygenase subunit alpha [Fuerstiella marisgermanici]|uniref:3-phenylpropionate/cinnamic acid dioxygenase subunit alpha n=1 Tax=Fuerstiella marisgermanici TaxID=1891926 RepID=A0A1P8W9X6_9PLAN|nr:aromatic ring-hydroxylating dioxygenase subunit alpha [Fuerstiella marisgermanici]APZ90859.1 3-phenylpropionate/cinnamic acid dioxygenase subunit alpha [Fuerstiella marisgermanici]
MFTHQHSLRHLLRPVHYTDRDVFDKEIECLFRPAWQFVAAKSELPRDGDFLTLELFGVPLLIRNSNGQFLAYENICCHRHCLLTSADSGNQPTLRCQYHGWEYNDSGQTARIPEARCFRPWDRQNSQLNMFPVESCGDLLFVRLSHEGPTLREWLTPFFDETEQAFSTPTSKMTHVWDYDCECNWKVPVENTLESYHVTALHQNFFGDTLPAEESMNHDLQDGYTALTVTATSKMEFAQARLNRWLGGKPTLEYRHRHIHPNLVLVSTDTINYALMYVPTSPRTVKIRMRFFAVRGLKRGPIASAISWLAWKYAKAKTLEVHNEDRGVYAPQQRGLEASRHTGVIGSREGRIYAFQRYLLKHLGLPVPDDPADAGLHSDEATAADSVRDNPAENGGESSSAP